MKFGGHESVYFRDTIYYSIGELGIHRFGFFLAINAGLWSAHLHHHLRPRSGPGGGRTWFDWYLRMPIWNPITLG